MAGTLVGADEDELLRRAARLMEVDGERGDPKAWIEGLRGEWIVGTIGQVLDRLGELARAGVQRVMLQHRLHDDVDGVRQIGEAIVPAVRDL